MLIHSCRAAVFAPELFEGHDEGSLAQASLAALAADAASSLEANIPPQGTPGQDPINHTPQLKHETSTGGEELTNSQYPLNGLGDNESAIQNLGADLDRDIGQLSEPQGSPEDKSKKALTDDPDKAHKSTKHSSKNEGQHTDRRYLCYVCNKLFTRRRSVRDHIAKIHSIKSWEPVRSLEIIVEPTTGEPLEPLEDIIARGPPAPPERPPKTPKVKEITEETTETADNEAQGVEEETEVAADTLVEPPSVPEPSPPPAPAEPSIKPEDPENRGHELTTPSIEPIAPPPPVIGKKRPAPDSVKSLPAALTKKGTARPKSYSTPNKKPKLAQSESINEKETTRSPSATPASIHKTPASKLKKQVNAASVTSSPSSSRVASLEPASPSPSAATPASSNDDGEIFCICRKGDNHSWMIACDGGCDDWFHGKCVSIRERDGDLIDKYICPNCTKPGLQTTWKRMCRRKSCRKPARVFEDPPSKYCSKECGRMFFVDLVRRGDPYIDTTRNDQFVVDGGRPKKLRKKRKHLSKTEKTPKAIPMLNGDVGELVNNDSRLATPAYSEEEKSEYETDTSADEDQLPNRGGALRAGEVKALIEKCNTIERWGELGRKPDTPPRELDEQVVNTELDTFEKARLEEVESQKAELEKRGVILEAREKLLEFIKTRSTSITDEVKKSNPKMKDLCGFDPRLGWSEELFLNWYNEQDGKQILESGKIGPPEVDEEMTNDAAGDESEGEDGKQPKKGGVCVRNRCPRHRQWAKGGLAEIRFEQDIVRRGIRRCEEQEKNIKQHAIVKAWEAS